eukprot:CAMPEP_0171959508 /NCGR_PEP_ID=MMETSP0993-20121228/148545_1 /TAXON_ID=483369 /ORGANISM="non described non described, Strain CCMP2098" /LENGTH=55 /DNA_ID=CAMNT_0012607035 /DNA_START=339 /DNA_END=503 /DNA_ORIENTATION=-
MTARKGPVMAPASAMSAPKLGTSAAVRPVAATTPTRKPFCCCVRVATAISADAFA